MTEGLFFIQLFALFRPAAKHLSKFETISCGDLFPELKIERKIVLNEKTSLAVVTTLIDMVGESRDVHPWTTWHSNSFAKPTSSRCSIGFVGCKNRVIEQFDVPNSDITVRLGATLQDDLDSGAITTKDLTEYGASFDWSVAGKDASGYCNVGGNGKVVEFKQW